VKADLQWDVGEHAKRKETEGNLRFVTPLAVLVRAASLAKTFANSALSATSRFTGVSVHTIGIALVIVAAETDGCGLFFLAEDGAN